MVRLKPLTRKKWRDLTSTDVDGPIARLLADPYSISRAFVDPSGRVVAAGGIGTSIDGPGFACAWLCLGRNAGPHLLGIIRGASYLLHRYADRWRVVTTGLAPEWDAFERVVAALGFEPALPPQSDPEQNKRWFELKTGASHALH